MKSEEIVQGKYKYTVAPLAGAWIEIKLNTTLALSQAPSLPSRERGLKSLYPVIPFAFAIVAPLAGAWIEIILQMKEFQF